MTNSSKFEANEVIRGLIFMGFFLSVFFFTEGRRRFISVTNGNSVYAELTHPRSTGCIVVVIKFFMPD